jgi:putative endonuclease
VIEAERERKLRAAAFGARAETLAALWLRLKGYQILSRQFTVRSGELDVVAARGATIAFVEVKARPSLEEALVAITESKRRRLCRAAAVWIARNPSAVQGFTLRGDAIFVGGWRLPLHIEDAFALEFSK